MTFVGIVGAEAAKFTPATAAKARAIIMRLLDPPDVVLVSGGCHLGGVDIWAEEAYEGIAALQPRPEARIFLPEVHEWARGYKPRNILIAEASDIVHNIVVARYPPTWTDMRFEACYHCITTTHVKSGGCWTAKYAKRLGKPAYWHIV